MIKTYQLTNDINLTTSVICDGKLKSISFAGGIKNSGEDLRRGSYTTADLKMQKALEADSGYGKTFRCITEAPTIKPRTLETSEMTNTDAMDGATKGKGEGNGLDANNKGPADFELIPGIANKQAAIEWLAANKGIGDLKPTCRVEAVRNAATLSGVAFPDWK